MSFSIAQFNIRDAINYNKKSDYVFNKEVLKEFPELLEPRDSEKFAWVVLALQKDHSFKLHECDGKLGWHTYTAIQKGTPPNYIVIRGEQRPINTRGEYKILTWQEKGGLDLHPFGNFSKRKQPPKAITLHWGGLDALHCFRVFASNSRQVSSHFLIGLDAKMKGVVYQTLDITHKAWHGGWVNDWTIGVDICQSPLPTWKEHYLTKGYDIQEKENETSRGHKVLMTLDSRLAAVAESFIEDLLEALDWSWVAPADHKVYKADIKDYTVFGHHHSNERKFDIAPWWHQIFPEEG